MYSRFLVYDHLFCVACREGNNFFTNTSSLLVWAFCGLQDPFESVLDRRASAFSMIGASLDGKRSRLKDRQSIIPTSALLASRIHGCRWHSYHHHHCHYCHSRFGYVFIIITMPSLRLSLWLPVSLPTLSSAELSVSLPSFVIIDIISSNIMIVVVLIHIAISHACHHSYNIHYFLSVRHLRLLSPLSAPLPPGHSCFYHTFPVLFAFPFRVLLFSRGLSVHSCQYLCVLLPVFRLVCMYIVLCLSFSVYFPLFLSACYALPSCLFFSNKDERSKPPLPPATPTEEREAKRTEERGIHHPQAHSREKTTQTNKRRGPYHTHTHRTNTDERQMSRRDPPRQQDRHRERDKSEHR